MTAMTGPLTTVRLHANVGGLKVGTHDVTEDVLLRLAGALDGAYAEIVGVADVPADEDPADALGEAATSPDGASDEDEAPVAPPAPPKPRTPRTKPAPE